MQSQAEPSRAKQSQAEPSREDKAFKLVCRCLTKIIIKEEYDIFQLWLRG
jgi:hypothetical protein